MWRLFFVYCRSEQAADNGEGETEQGVSTGDGRQSILRTYTANKSVTNAISAVKRLHLDCGADVEVFSAPGVERWKRALPLTVRTFPRPAPPLSVGVLEQLCVAAGGGGRRTTTIVALFSILFHSMARLSSLLPLTAGAFDLTRHAAAEDCSWVGGRLWFRVKWSKTQQRTEQAFWVPLLPREGSPACPVEALHTLRGGAAPQRGSPLFCGAPGVALSIPVARQWLSVILRCIGLSADAFSFHSFRRGACTAAFASGAHLEDLKALGGWRSDALARYRSPADARLREAQAGREAGGAANATNVCRRNYLPRKIEINRYFMVILGLQVFHLCGLFEMVQECI